MSISPNYEARLSANHTPVTFHLPKNEEEIEDSMIYNKRQSLSELKKSENSMELSKNKLSSSSLDSSKTNEFENDDLDESLDDEGSYYKKFKRYRPSLNPKKNLILLNTLDEENSINKTNETRNFSVKENSNLQVNKRRKISSISDQESISNISDDIEPYENSLEQVVQGDDSKLTFKNCLLKTMNEILRTNLQLSRKVDQIRENNFSINKRLRKLEEILKTRNIKDQEIEEELEELNEENLNSSKNSEEIIKNDIKLEKVVNEPKTIIENSSSKDLKTESQTKSNQQVISSARRMCENSPARNQDYHRQTHVNFRPSHNSFLPNQNHYNFNYNGHPHGNHDPYHQYSYRYNGVHHGPLSVGVGNTANPGVPGYRGGPTPNYISPSANGAQNPKTAAALAAAVAVAMAASANQNEYQETEENEYEDSIEDDNSPYSQNPEPAISSAQFSSIVPQHAPIRHIPSSIVDQLELSEDVERLVSRDVIKRCIRKAKHRGNFAANLAAELFTKEERITCNCTGTRGKRQLSPRRLQIVKEITFRMYNSQQVQAATITGGQQSAAALLQDFEEAWRKECITAIDAKNRSIGRDLIKNTNSSYQPNQQSISPSISSTTNNSNSAPVINEVY